MRADSAEVLVSNTIPKLDARAINRNEDYVLFGGTSGGRSEGCQSALSRGEFRVLKEIVGPLPLLHGIEGLGNAPVWMRCSPRRHLHEAPRPSRVLQICLPEYVAAPLILRGSHAPLDAWAGAK